MESEYFVEVLKEEIKELTEKNEELIKDIAFHMETCSGLDGIQIAELTEAAEQAEKHAESLLKENEELRHEAHSLRALLAVKEAEENPVRNCDMCATEFRGKSLYCSDECYFEDIDTTDECK